MLRKNLCITLCSAIALAIHGTWASTLPAKRTPREIVIFEESSRTWFKNNLMQRGVEIQIYATLPPVIIDIIKAYESRYSEQSCTVQVWSFQNHCCRKQTSRYKHKLILHIPLRINGSSLELWQKDVFKACEGVFNAPMTKRDWLHTADNEGDKKKFNEFWEEHVRILNYGNAHSPYPITFPSCTHFPLTIYWQNEAKPLTNNRAEELVEKRGDQDSKGIIKACYDILKAHKRLPSHMKPSDLLILCSACRGHLQSGLTFYHLIERRRQLAVQSQYCTGAHRLCRAYRALLVFPKNMILFNQ